MASGGMNGLRGLLVNNPSHKSCLMFPRVCTTPTMQCKEEREQTWEKSGWFRRKKAVFYTTIASGA